MTRLDDNLNLDPTSPKRKNAVAAGAIALAAILGVLWVNGGVSGLLFGAVMAGAGLIVTGVARWVSGADGRGKSGQSGRTSAVTTEIGGSFKTEADELPADARGEADLIPAEAQRKAETMMTEVRQRADAMLAEAQASFEAQLRQAQDMADALQADAERKHSEIMGSINHQRTVLEEELEKLRRLERGYRTRLETYVESAAESDEPMNVQGAWTRLESQPSGISGSAAGGRPESATPETGADPQSSSAPSAAPSRQDDMLAIIVKQQNRIRELLFETIDAHQRTVLEEELEKLRILERGYRTRLETYVESRADSDEARELRATWRRLESQLGGLSDSAARERTELATGTPEPIAQSVAPTSPTSTHEVVAFLAQQHLQITELFSETINAPDEATRHRRFVELRSLMASHEAAKEMVVHPIVREKVPGGEAIVAARLQEENQAKQQFKKIEGMDIGSPEFINALTELQLEVTDHYDREEAEQFDALNKALTEDSRMQMGKAVAAAVAIASGMAIVSGVLPFASLLDRARDMIAAALR
jgi:Hemerythrin HHE cation binding domain